jgi:hypothetical protein
MPNAVVALERIDFNLCNIVEEGSGHRRVALLDIEARALIELRWQAIKRIGSARLAELFLRLIRRQRMGLLRTAFE